MTASSIANRSLSDLARQTRAAARNLAALSGADRNFAVSAIATALAENAEAIAAANAEDLVAAAAEGIPQPLQARLKLDASKLQGAIAGVRGVEGLPDPVGLVQIRRELDAGLILERVTCPLGVIGVIFESRPDALIQIACLALKSGNGVILKGGREALHSCRILVDVIHRALASTAVDPAAVQLLTTREEIRALLSLDSEVDLIVPRGSNAFVRYIQDNTRIPVLGHADGICHLYIDATANREQAIAIAVDSKTQYPAACNAIETLLVHADAAPTLLPAIASSLRERGVTLRGCERSRKIVPMAAATDEDWATEYCDLLLSVRVVDSAADAIAHINTYGSRHTDAIVTDDAAVAETFLSQVDTAGAFHNCSTRFSDGFRYGFGAEVGISTQTLPPRGPVGLEGLVTYKYRVVGDGHVADTYSGEDAKPFTHRDF
ncbi:gamma-glutamyl phosphate reductase [Rubidibacter lacunae KORDI 51-2]|uniref:Gamma-glutamyl phosphate reductase n=1 Tax=Rubidibacter lacunae KORDI 51-2 TaxID=582515 RepID=U5DF17_9CHRO|nr:glutamate-5-semialdehyde dehydrogenase [Rubidibacter lacunae]ERN39902.1 gamma-glutamyl phosphate reductase [Rubidibacter lacunae KORDI 51-2]